MNKKLRKTFTMLGLSVSVILMDCNHEMNLGNNDFSKKPKVIAFQGILSNLSQIGAKKLTEDMESDAGVAFIDSAEDVLNGLLKFTDGMLDNYTFGFYKAVSGIIFPDETKPNPQIEKLQESVDKIQDSVFEICMILFLDSTTWFMQYKPQFTVLLKLQTVSFLFLEPKLSLSSGILRSKS